MKLNVTLAQVETVVTVASEVLRATCTTFESDIDNRALCVLMTGSITVFAHGGSEYVMQLPEKVRHIRLDSSAVS